MNSIKLKFVNEERRGKGNGFPVISYAMKTSGRVDAWVHVFLASALVEGQWSASYPSRFIPVDKAPGTHLIGGCVGHRVGLDGMEK
jgi:hypothetical protein